MPGYRVLPALSVAPLKIGLRPPIGWLLLLLTCLTTMVSPVAHAEQVQISWNPVTDSRVAFYEVHYGTASTLYQWQVRTSETFAVIADLISGSPYFFAVRACTQDGTLCSPFSREVSTTGLGASARLSVSVTTATGTTNLKDQGATDWVHWGRSAVTSVNRKAGVAAQIGALRALGGSPERFENTARLAYRWTNGAPTTSAFTQTGLRIKGVDKGFELSVPADTIARTLTLYVGGYQALGRVEVRLSDGSAPEYSAVFGNLTTFFDRRVAVTYRAASGGKRLNLRFTQAVKGHSISVQAATLRSASTP